MRIVAKGLSYTYNKKTEFPARALDGVTITIESGEFFGVIGHTGSGKSTFIQHLNGLIPVDEGELKVGDVNLKTLSKKEYRAVKNAEICPEAYESGRKLSYRKYKKKRAAELKLLRSEVGMVFQYPEYQLFGETVFADVAFGLKNFRPDMPPEEVKATVSRAIERVGLDFDEIAERSPFDLSGGQKRRVAIAGVIVTEPKILVLDEPVAGLDPVGKRELLALLKDLHGGAVETVVIVSHDMDDVAEVCSKVAVFSEGKLLAALPPKELFKNGELLRSVGLELPVTAELAEKLEKLGLEIDTDFTADNFARAVAELYKNTKSGLNPAKKGGHDA